MSKRTTLPAVALALAATLVAGACGSAGTNSPAEQGGGDGVFPVKIEHKYGTTEITKRPQRVVTLGLSDHETALALDVKPVGVVDWFKERPFGVFPWQKEKWAGTEPTIVGERDDINMEKVASLRPDLVIAGYSGIKKEQYETLTKLNIPVVAQSAKHPDYATPWEEMARTIGKALGKDKELDAKITALKDRFAKIRADHPEWAKQTALVADTAQPGVYAAFAAHDPKLAFLLDLGFQTPDRLRQAPKEQNIIEIGSEGLPDLFEVDRLIWLTEDANLEKKVKADPVYQRLKVFQDKRDMYVPYNEPPIGAAISFNTVLSMPYALEHLVPLLVNAKK
ncbi:MULTISPECIES: iron-siderophore ABC transporter substrate-binding protein [unclassified Crossiella]|uniref:iron-siderophore ABC transporter substrate-binding protein n=1 Tax=unclassified Crossiella TaxID=2620835 RepID=UPI001FFE9FC9|nr:MULTISPECIES: iron-siderophore ABC transporter substrate-binding protein [unclassified Crossiella]MCK2238460.1 iron-siderophore ABC transporter substrate-binding protein [Crossiella sp. S99.2]MCK2251970.1 iron-siderophore ABC transporter substrate-binding protein [Crossiella sp. S99.1]